MEVKDIKPDSIETVFAIPMRDCPKKEMTEDQTNMMFGLFMSKVTEAPPEIKAIFPFQVLEKRVECSFNYKLDDKTKVFIVYMSDGNLGILVMYLTYLQYISKTKSIKEITFSYFCESIFPWGFPSEEEFNKLWSNQKVTGSKGCDNLLDYEEALTSIL